MRKTSSLLHHWRSTYRELSLILFSNPNEPHLDIITRMLRDRQRERGIQTKMRVKLVRRRTENSIDDRESTS